MDKFDLGKITSGDHEFDKSSRDIVEKGTLRINDYLAPDGMINEPTYIAVGARFLRTIMITGYPRTAHIGWLNRLYSYGANIDISMHIEPLATNKVIKTLNRKISQYISTQRIDEERGKITDIAIEAALEDAEELREKLQKGIEKFFYQSVYININAKSLEELDQVTEEIESLCGNIGMNTRIAMYQQTQGFHTVLPLAEDRLRFRRNFDSSSLATCFPFVSAELTDMTGLPILYGINLINGSLVMFDRFQLNNYNSVILATSGAGEI